MKAKICQHCGKEFVPKDERKNRQAKYCSRKCRDLARTTRVTLTCCQCGKSFERKAYLVKGPKERGIFCGFDCYGKWQSTNLVGKGRKRIPVTCDTCGKEFEKQPHAVTIHNFCSRECVYVWRTTDFWTGKNSPSWRGGNDGYRGENWNRQRQKALKRDSHTCQNCDKEGAKSVHHKRPYVLFDHYKDANELANLVTLCSSCHTKADAKFWREHPQEYADAGRPSTIRIKACEKCGANFEMKTPASKYCQECHYHICSYCGKRFFDKRVYTVKYCSQKCNYDDHRIWPHKCVHCGNKIASGRTRCWDCFMTIDNPRRQYSEKLKAARAVEAQK